MSEVFALLKGKSYALSRRSGLNPQIEENPTLAAIR